MARLTWRIALYWVALLGGLWLFIELTEEIYEDGGVFFDEPVLTWFYGLISPFLNQLAFALSVLGSLNVMVLLSVLVTASLGWLARREAVFFALSMGGASLVMVVTKYVLARDRPLLFPDMNLWQEASPSFPSGHSTGSFAFFLTLYLVVGRLYPRWRYLVALLGITMTLGISLSRLYLQVHYPSDILAGWAIAAAWVLGVNSLYGSHRRDHSTKTVLLTLPLEVVEAYRAAASREGRSDDEIVAQALSAQLGARQADGAEPLGRR